MTRCRDNRGSGGRLGGRGRRNGGFALLVVLFLVILLAVVSGGYAIKVNTSHRLARSRAESWKLLFAARAGVEEAKARLWRQAYGVSLEQPPEVVLSSGSGRYTLPADKETQDILKAPEPLTLNIEGVRVVVEFEDEAGKLPVNNFAAGDPAGAKSLTNCLVRLFDELEMKNPTSLATAVRDFIDADNKGTGERGAKNAFLFHVSELAGARGFDARMLYVPASDQLPAAAWCLSAWHTGRVNINSAGGIVLSSLVPRLTEGDIGEIIAARGESPFSSVADLRARTGISDDVLVQLSRETGFKTDTFGLYVEASLGVFRRRVKAVVWVESSAAHTLYFGEGWQF